MSIHHVPTVMATHSGDTGRPTDAEAAMVDPRAPRFGQTLTALGLLGGILLAEPLLVLGVTAVLVTAVATGYRADLWAVLWRRGAVRVVGRPTEHEPAAPHRFAKVLGAGMTALASLLLLVGFPTAGYAVAGLVAALAGLAAVTDVCVGCRMYRGVSLFRRLGVV